MMRSVMVDSTGENLSNSPIFPCRQLTSQQSAVSASTTSGSVTKLQDTNCLSSSSSPWLSKDRGISNGKASVKTVAQSGYVLHLVECTLITSSDYPSSGRSSARAVGARCSAPAAPHLVTRATEFSNRSAGVASAVVRT